jgi:hypothetical protein
MVDLILASWNQLDAWLRQLRAISVGRLTPRLAD